MLSLNDVLNLYANGMAPIADGDGWLVTCPLCANLDLRIIQKPKSISVLCRKGCRTFDILDIKKIKQVDLKTSANGYHPPPPSNPPPPPPPQPAQAPQPHQPRPAKRLIDVSTDELPKRNAECWRAIEEQNNPPSLFLHGDGMVRVRYDYHDDALIADPLDTKILRHELSQWADWEKTTVNPKTGVPKTVETRPPTTLVEDILCSRVLPLPRLHRVVSVPVFASDGKLLTTPGYNASSGVIYAPPRGYKSLPVPDQITTSDLKRAKALIEEVLTDFPFSVNEAGDSADHDNAIALFLLPFARDLIDGSTPLHLIEASMPGSGKGLLASALLYPGMGKIFGTALPGEDDELRKLITSQIVACKPLIFIDNINRALVSAELCAALTMELWDDRVLGSSRTANAKVRALWLATANNISMSTEITRRVVRIRIAPQTDRPEERTGFAHEDLMEWIEANRPELVRAAHIIIKYALQEGLPKPHNRNMASFLRYSRVMGSILECAGYSQFLANHRELDKGSDIEREALSLFAMTWFEWAQANKRDAVTTSELLPIAENIDGIRLKGATDKARQTWLGMWLKSKHEVVTEYADDDPSNPVSIYKLRILNMGIGKGKQRGSQIWRVECLETVNR